MNREPAAPPVPEDSAKDQLFPRLIFLAVVVSVLLFIVTLSMVSNPEHPPVMPRDSYTRESLGGTP